MSDNRQMFLSDIIIGAVEGGTGYWAQASEYHWSDEHPETTTVKLHDMEEDDQEYVLTTADVEKALTVIAGPRQDVGMSQSLRNLITQCSSENDASNIDANGADCIAQVACFGSVVYG
jgi:hypothetical protein